MKQTEDFPLPIRNQFWQAILDHDPRFDGKFVYGMVSTGIYCRPSCTAQRPEREDIRFFASAKHAQAAGFRACQRCALPEKVSTEVWVEQMCAFIERNYAEEITLKDIAKSCFGSPSYLQRIFVQVKGCSPAEYLLSLRLEQSKKLLRESDLSIKEIANAVGMPNPSHFSLRFREAFGASPRVYRRQYEYQKEELF